MDASLSAEVARCVFRESSDALFVFDPRDQRVLDVNPTAQRLTGFGRKALRGMTVADLFHSREPGGVARIIQAYQATGFFHSQEGYYLIRAEGAPLAVNVSVSRIHTEPEPLGLAMARDVTEHRRTQEILDRFFHLSPDLFCIASLDRYFVKLNPAWEQTLGYSLAELMAVPYAQFLHPDDWEPTVAAGAALRRGEPVSGFENRYRHKDGGYRWLSWRCILGDGLIYGVARDVTERKQFERALEEARDAAEVASRAKSAFLANMSHEMRTPLTAILGFTDVLLEDPWVRRAPGERLEDLKIIQQNGLHLLELIDDILDLSKVEAGRTVVQRVACSPGRIAADVAAALRVRAVAKGLGLEFEFATPIPETIRTDPVRLRQILINLVGNAIKFTEAGGIRILLGLDHDGRAEPLLWLEVVDSGIGMTSAEQANLFQPYCRADLPASQKAGGTGLGLAISKRLAELLGGAITVQSLLGQGSTFRLTIATGPLHGVPLIRRPEDARLAPEETPPETPRARSLRDRRVLVAEDNPTNQRVVTIRLERAGAAVTVARNGLEALEQALTARAAGRPFDVVLMDMQMPVLDGYEATRLLRAQHYDGPIVALTAYAMAEDRDECLRFGCTDHLSKPIDWDRLIGLIADLPDNSPQGTRGFAGGRQGGETD